MSAPPPPRPRPRLLLAGTGSVATVKLPEIALRLAEFAEVRKQLLLLLLAIPINLYWYLESFDQLYCKPSRFVNSCPFPPVQSIFGILRDPIIHACHFHAYTKPSVWRKHASFPPSIEQRSVSCSRTLLSTSGHYRRITSPKSGQTSTPSNPPPPSSRIGTSGMHGKAWGTPSCTYRYKNKDQQAQ